MTKTEIEERQTMEKRPRDMTVKERYEYLKTTSTEICDYLEEKKFGVSKEELDVFIQLLQKELEFRRGF